MLKKDELSKKNYKENARKLKEKIGLDLKMKLGMVKRSSVVHKSPRHLTDSPREKIEEDKFWPDVLRWIIYQKSIQ